MQCIKEQLSNESPIQLKAPPPLRKQSETTEHIIELATGLVIEYAQEFLAIPQRWHNESPTDLYLLVDA